MHYFDHLIDNQHVTMLLCITLCITG